MSRLKRDLSIYLSICLSIYLSICLSIYLSIYLFFYVSIYLPTYLSICLSIYLSIYLSIHLSIYLPISLSLSIYLSFFLFFPFLSVCLTQWMHDEYNGTQHRTFMPLVITCMQVAGDTSKNGKNKTTSFKAKKNGEKESKHPKNV